MSGRPLRLSERGAGLLALTAAVTIGIAALAAWAAGPAQTAPVVFSGSNMPSGSPSVAWPSPDLWPGSGGPVEPARSGLTRYRGIAGVGCRSTSESGYYVAYPAGSIPDTRRGGWVGTGCTGSFWTIPMSGTTVDDLGRFVLWWFAPRGMTRGSCDVMVYVPRPTRPQDAAGRPTAYIVLRGREDATAVGTFTIMQSMNQGRWVSPVSPATLSRPQSCPTTKGGVGLFHAAPSLSNELHRIQRVHDYWSSGELPGRTVRSPRGTFSV